MEAPRGLDGPFPRVGGSGAVSRPSGFWRSGRSLLGLLLVLHTAVSLWLVLDRRLPRGHDTLGNYFLQYLFASHASQGDGVPLWMPYVAHGLPSNWALTIQGGLFQNALLALGGPPGGANFLILFHLGMYLDELVLILGVWALGRRFSFSPLALFFTAAAAAGSTLWADQVYWNHRALFALPLVLALLQGFLEEGRRWKLHAGLNLLVLQVMGNVPYIAFLTGFVVLVYLLAYVAVWRRRLARSRALLRPAALDALLLPLHLAAFGAVAATFLEGTGEIVQFRHGRNPDGSVPLDAFLTYGGGTSPVRYLEMLLGTPPSLEYSLYSGAPVLALALLAFALRPGRRVLALGLATALVLSFSLGASGLVAPAAFQAMPLFRYFRYVALAAPVVRLLLILLAGLGFDALLRRARPPEGPRRAVAAALLGTAVAVGGLCALVAAGPVAPPDVLGLLKSGRFGMSSCEELRRPETMLPVLGASALAAGLGALLLFRRPGAAVLVLLALLEAGDVYRWKLQMLALKTAPLDGAAYAAQEVGPVPYAPRRNGDYLSSPRYAAMAPAFLDYGVTYDFTDGFLHLDPPSSRFWTHHWLRPVDALARAYGTRFHGSESAAAEALAREHRRLFPGSLPAFDRVLGVTEDKLRVFSRAHAAGPDARIAELMADPTFEGDVLLLSISPRQADATAPESPPPPLGADERAPAFVKVLASGPGRLVVEVEAEPGSWLVYADAWHPSWTATARDGGAVLAPGSPRPVPVKRAFLAYKTVQLPWKRSVVEFRFESPLRSLAYRFLGWNSLVWVLGTLAAFARLLARGPGGPAGC